MKLNKLKFLSYTPGALLMGLLVISTQLTAKPPVLSKHGIRSNVLWPIYPGGKFRFSYRGSFHGNEDLRTEILFGVSHGVPEPRPTEGVFTETSGVLGIRQFLYSPWHFEVNAAYGRGSLSKAVSPGLLNPRTLGLAQTDVQYLVWDEVLRRRNYSSVDLEVMGLVGYEWKLGEHLSLDLQAGAAKVVSKSNPWPLYLDADRIRLTKEGIIPVGVVNLTYWF
jgi:hypothetical protein